MIKQINLGKLDKIITECVRNVLKEEEGGKNLYRRWLDLQKKHGPEKVLYAVWKELDTDTIETIINTMEGQDNGTENE